ncbi:phage tail assembly protein, partial [Escherichia coli]
MAELTFELKHGLLTGKGTADETLHKTVKLRELTASDVIDAQLAAERVVLGENGKAVAYCSEVLMGLEMMRRQVAAIGSIPGPLDMKQLRMLHPA